MRGLASGSQPSICLSLSQAIAIMEVAHGKDHPYISEIKQEIESH